MEKKIEIDDLSDMDVIMEKIVDEDTLKQLENELFGSEKKSKREEEQVNPNEKQDERKPFAAPEKAETTENVENYLIEKMKFNKGIVYDCIKGGSIYQTAVYSDGLNKDINCAVFAGLDENGEIKNAVMKDFQNSERVIAGSQQKYGFLLKAIENSSKPATSVSVFENPIELLAGATLAKIKDKISYKGVHRLSLGSSSVSEDKENIITTAALKHFLESNPQVKTVSACVSNTENGRKYLEKIQGLLDNLVEQRGKAIKLNNLLPKDARDFHHQLLKKLGDMREKKKIEVR